MGTCRAEYRVIGPQVRKLLSRPWNHFREWPVSLHGTDGGTIAMRIEYLAAIAIAAFVAGTGLAVHSVGSLPPEKQSTPVAAQLALAESVDPFLHRTGG